MNSSDLFPRNFDFPFTKYKGASRKFQTDWLTKFNWLVYLPSQNSCICKICIVFGPGKYGNKNLITQTFQNWKNANEQFEAHSKSVNSNHNTNLEKSENFNLNIKS